MVVNCSGKSPVVRMCSINMHNVERWPVFVRAGRGGSSQHGAGNFRSPARVTRWGSQQGCRACSSQAYKRVKEAGAAAVTPFQFTGRRPCGRARQLCLSCTCTRGSVVAGRGGAGKQQYEECAADRSQMPSRPITTGAGFRR